MARADQYECTMCSKSRKPTLLSLDRSHGRIRKNVKVGNPLCAPMKRVSNPKQAIALHPEPSSDDTRHNQSQRPSMNPRQGNAIHLIRQKGFFVLDFTVRDRGGI